MLLYGKYDYFNIGIDKPEITISQLAEIYAQAGREILGYTGRVTYGRSEDTQYLTDNPQRRCPSIETARRLLGYAPSILVEEGIRRFLTFIKESDEGVLKW